MVFKQSRFYSSSLKRSCLYSVTLGFGHAELAPASGSHEVMTFFPQHLVRLVLALSLSRESLPLFIALE